jgi:hypothetical protein
MLLINIILASICVGTLVDAPARADESADQIERALLLQKLLESRPPAQPDHAAPGIPGAQINPQPGPAAAEGVRRQQFEDSQWRKLLGSQQMQLNAPATQSVPQAQWRAQAFERDRAAEALSADILRRSQGWTNGPR